ncbi:SH3 domain-containing protein [bacterium]|nr:SH3 domain-containing protein [bacterium]
MLQRLISVFLLLYMSGCAVLPGKDGPPPRHIAEYPLANCHPGMEDANYWIRKYVFRDQLLLSPGEIQKLNRKNHSRGLLTNVFADKLWEYKYVEVERPGEDNPAGEWNLERPTAYSPGALGGYTLYTYLKDETERIKRRTRWDVNGRAVARTGFLALDENLNLTALREDNPIRYGLTRQRTDVRYYPTDMLITGRRWDIDFDILQVSAVRALQPVAVLHESRDKKWVFVVTAYCRGWVLREHITEKCNPRAVRMFTDPKKFIMVTGHSVEVLEAGGSTQVAQKLYMGTQCPLLQTTANFYIVGLPVHTPAGNIRHHEAYIPRTADVHVGYLAYTPRNICQQAFKLLETPYAWGGKGEYRDCSQMVMDVYACMGIVLPRNSSAQARVGSSRYAFDKGNTILQRRAELDGIHYPVLLQFPGHIMLYLGRENEHYYAIHDIWAYRVLEKPNKDRKIIIGKVVVSDLSLGEGSTRGSLIQRLSIINLVRP